MSLFALLLLFLSAFLHTAWNFLLKQAGDKFLAAWWAMLIASVIMLPVLAFTGIPARAIWPYVVASGVMEAIYFGALAAGYTVADFSLIYPLGRGAAPALITVGSILFLHEKLTPGGWVGLFTIIAGLLVVGGGAWFRQAETRPSIKGVMLALFVALTISIYSVIDGAAMKRTSPVSYIILVFFVMSAVGAPLIWTRYRWQTMASSLKSRVWRLLAIGLVSMLAYGMVLKAYAISPVSYSGAIREVSVVIAAFAGWKFLNEKLGGVRLAGAVIIFCGILCIALFG
jgi:drug/metabolite transporter (DMT)-like permease